LLVYGSGERSQAARTGGSAKVLHRGATPGRARSVRDASMVFQDYPVMNVFVRSLLVRVVHADRRRAFDDGRSSRSAVLL